VKVSIVLPLLAMNVPVRVLPEMQLRPLPLAVLQSDEIRIAGGNPCLTVN
jgi:hypothetical protein